MFLISYQTGQWQNSQNLQLQLDDSDSERKYEKTAEFEFSEHFHNKLRTECLTHSSKREKKVKPASIEVMVNTPVPVCNGNRKWSEIAS